jgi:RNA polymerase sigma factor (sigma-70 family)
MEGTKLSFHSAEERIVLKELEDERYQLFLKAQESLTKRQKEILYLRLEHGLTNAEISEFLDISMQRVKNCIYESIKLLREKVYQISVEKSA